MTIRIVGLGPGDPGQLTRRAWDVLSGASETYLRTRIHPTVEHLPEGPTYHSFDDLYESIDEFSQVYDTIVERLVEKAQVGDVVYAVPGDPMIAEGTVTRLIAVCGVKEIAFEIIHGISFIEPTLAALELDGVTGLQILDATDLSAIYHPPVNPDAPALIAQLYGQHLASDVKLTLMNQYPDEHPVKLIHAAGTDQQRVEVVPLYEIDRGDLAHLTTLYIPPFDSAPGAVTSFEGFQNTLAHLRDPEKGCPWDVKQTHESLRTNVIEEAYEVVDAIDSGEVDQMREELGDLLLLVAMQVQIAVDEGEFQMAEVIRQIDAKLKRRHPHVWGGLDVNGDVNQVFANWEEIKAQERKDKGQAEKSLLDGIPRSMPALAQSHEYDSRAVHVGFDWPDEKGVIDKVREEFDEVLEAVSPEEKFHEIGDLLLVVAVWARWMGINPEDALRAANCRFYERFSHIERRAREQGRELQKMTLEEMDELWNEAKRNSQNK